ncbi:hypothetical protein [Micromonospora sp. DH14]|uniref:hypothetical protein n=1 Tax=Micromonospora sp. DH14 TaxID=3040120 RepID=UPI0024414B62|nr:hypothetical protein [Micromonospora sp. DH14]MDG9679036.1 hypothetical protein [Micromonospora sp. DH14]
MSDSTDTGYQAFRRSGQTGKTRSVSQPGTADQARAAVIAKRQKLQRGSSDTFEVRKPRR